MSRSTNGERACHDGDVHVVRVRGELDLATADSLYQRGRAAIRRHARLLLLDLTGLSFCDSCGLSAFVRIANEADAVGCRYGLIAPQPLVVKILRITRLDHRLPVFATIDEARRRLAAPGPGGSPSKLAPAPSSS
jgi:anti-sigma B factor antagonist